MDWKQLRVLSVKETACFRARPLPLNTVEMLKFASKALGMGPKECTVFAERLYLKGYISYPRTESSAYPQHYNLLYRYLYLSELTIVVPWKCIARIQYGVLMFHL